MAYIYNKYLSVDNSGNVSLTSTPTVGDSSTKVATTAFVATAITNSGYNPNNVNVTGGTINNTTLGATTPSVGSFTTGNFSGALTLTSANVTGTLTLTGAMIETTRVITAAGNLTALATDTVIAMNKTVGAATTITLPAAPATGRFMIVKDAKGDAAANPITINPSAGNIDGGTSVTINANYGSVDLVYNGSAWNILAGPV